MENGCYCFYKITTTKFCETFFLMRVIKKSILHTIVEFGEFPEHFGEFSPNSVKKRTKYVSQTSTLAFDLITN
jgi:hypothetical protein